MCPLLSGGRIIQRRASLATYCLRDFQLRSRYNDAALKVHVFQLLTTFVSRCLHCTGDATHHILTTGRIRYTKQLPDAPAAPVAATPSCSSMVVRWKPPVNAGDYPIIGYRLLRRAGGATKMRFGREIAVDEKTFKVCFAENLIILFPL